MSGDLVQSEVQLLSWMCPDKMSGEAGHARLPDTSFAADGNLRRYPR